MDKLQILMLSYICHGCGLVIPISTFIWARVSDWLVNMSGHYRDLVRDGFRILILLVGTH